MDERANRVRPDDVKQPGDPRADAPSMRQSLTRVCAFEDRCTRAREFDPHAHCRVLVADDDGQEGMTDLETAAVFDDTGS